MLIYLYGPDSYRLQEKLRSIIEEYKKKHSGLTIEYFDFATGDEIWEKFKEFIGSQSLFGGSRLAITSNCANEKEKAEFLKNFSDHKTASLIIIAEKPLGKDFSFLLKKPVLSQGFELLNGAQTVSFIKKEAEKRKLKLLPETINALIQANGSDLWGIIREIEKIVLGGEVGQTVTVPDFFAMISKLSGRAPFSLKISALTWLLETDDAAKVFNMVSAFTKVTADKVKMADYDVAIKSGKLEYEEALLDLVISS